MIDEQPAGTTNGVGPASSPLVFRVFLYAMIFFMPLESIGMGPLSGQITPTRLIGYLLLPLSILSAKICFGKIPKAFWCFGTYLAVYWLQALTIPGNMWDFAFQFGSTMTQLLVLFWILTNVLEDDQLNQGMAFTFAMGCLGLAICQYLHLSGVGDQHVAAQTLSKGRESALSDDPNRTAQYYCLGILCCIGILVGKWPLWQKFAVAPTIPLMLVYMMALGARGEVIALIVGSAVFLLAGRTIGQKLVLFTAILALVLGVFVVSASSRSRKNASVFLGVLRAGR